MEQQTAQIQDCKSQTTFGDVAPISKLIFSVTKHLRRTIEQQARLQDMTLPQWRALAQVHHSDGLSQAALATLIETDPMTTSKIVRLLEARGLVERLPDPADSRAKIVRATPPVTQMVQAMKANVAELHNAMLIGISEADQETLVRVLNQISDNLAGQADRPKDLDQ
ncbi:MAG TPA: MarR family transcriptional regulator [Devosia sp.]|jgi:DNA-binding MarR family transcriptional regulator|nr:MarR family transcriptional regulator [Devosia sp.]